MCIIIYVMNRVQICARTHSSLIIVENVLCRTLHFRICQRYEEFNKKALAVPQDSQEIMELISYMETARNQLVRELYVDVEDSMKRLRFLLDMYLFTGEEIELNQNTLMWPKKLDPIFEENEKVGNCLIY